MLCSFALFVSSFGFIDPYKPHWGSGQLRFLVLFYFFIIVFLSTFESSLLLFAHLLMRIVWEHVFFYILCEIQFGYRQNGKWSPNTALG